MIENFLSDEEMTSMKNEIMNIVNDMDPSTHPTSVFTTTNEKQVIRVQFIIYLGKILHYGTKF